MKTIIMLPIIIGTSLNLCAGNLRSSAKFALPIANAGPDKTIYLTQTSTATLDGSISSGDTYQWTEISTDYMSGATITSPTSKVTTVTGLPQGVFYFQIAATTEGTTIYDSMKVIVDYFAPPKNATLALALPLEAPAFATMVNRRDDTTSYFSYVAGKEQYWEYFMPNGVYTTPGIVLSLERDRTNGMMLDSMRGKLYNTIEDGYGPEITSVTGEPYARSTTTYGNTYAFDTTQTYVLDLKMYFPQPIAGNFATTPDWGRVAIAGMHGNDNGSGSTTIEFGKDSLDFYASTMVTNPITGLIGVTLGHSIDWVNNTHTIRVMFREGSSYPNQKGFYNVQVDGRTVYTCDTGKIGKTLMTDYNKMFGLYDYRNLIVNPDSLTRHKKFSIVTENADIWVMNNVPTVEAGEDQTISTTSAVLSGSATDEGVSGNGIITSYLWTKLSGGSATIASPTSSTTSLTGLANGTYEFKLTATDDSGISGSDTVQIIVNSGQPNNPPTANAGADLSITLPVNTVTLSGNGNDTDGSISSYQWSKISGPPSYSIVSPDSSTTNVIGLSQGVYNFQLTVTDNGGAIGTASVQITVNAATNVPPIANAGTNQTITLPSNNVSLSGSGSDTDGTIASYQWAMISGPANYNIVDPSSSVTNVTGLTQGTYTFQLTVTDIGGAIGTSTVMITVNAASNIPPTANAGTSQTITLPTNSVSINGSGSDVDGTIASYQWTKISGPSTYNISSPNSSATNITGLTQGVYQFQLTVTDNAGAVGSATVEVTVNVAEDIPPTANAGSDVSINLPTNSVSLTGSGSDADGTISSYQWTKISGPSFYNIVSPGSAATNISGLVQGVYQFQLTVTDNTGDIATSTVQVAVNATPNIPPTANAGSNQTITLPTNSVSLSGSGNDADGTIASYKWTEISGPSSYNIVNASSPVTDVSGLVQGVFQFQLTVTDNKGAIGSAIVKVTVNAAANIPPTANAGSDKTLTLPANSVSLTGTGSDTDGTIASYQWTKISGPSNYNIVSPNSPVTNITGLAQGVYQFQLTVTDNKGAIGTANVQVQVNAAANIPPTANAGPNQTITLPTNSVSLSGSGNDADGFIASYKWAKTSGPSTYNIVNAPLPVTDVSGLVQGVYHFQLTVTDNMGAIGTSIVQVKVNSAANIPPTANAGSNQTITLPTNIVSLAGSGSDADGTVASYQWSKISGPSTYNIVNASSPVTDVSGLVQGVYHFQLTVTDNKGAIGTSIVQITVNAEANIPPTANAGSNKSITLPTNSVSLAGSGSDADGTIASYQWTKISGPSLYNIGSPNSATTNVSSLVQGIYQFQLTVTDNKGATSKATVQITVNVAVNIPPSANVGPNQTITLPTNSVSLAGSGSDADGTISSYQWIKISGPSSYNIVNSSSPVTIVSGLIQGVYQFQLTVTDNNGGTGIATTQVTVNAGASVSTAIATPNIVPVANAGNDTTIVYPDNSVMLNGSGTEVDGNVVTYLWNQVSGPSSSTIFPNNTASTNVSNLVEGNYEFELTVTDAKGAIGKDTVNVIVASGRYARESNNVKIYPNPVLDITNLVINTAQANTNIIITITDLSGKSVYREELVSSTNSITKQINMSNLIKGTYVITVFFDGVNNESVKVLKM